MHPYDGEQQSPCYEAVPTHIYRATFGDIGKRWIFMTDMVTDRVQRQSPAPGTHERKLKTL
jgi:hypothetical protein